MPKERPLTGLDILREELSKILKAKSNCADKYGVVFPWHRSRYLILTKKERAFKEAIQWLEDNNIGVRMSEVLL